MLDRYRNAIASIESAGSGGYAAIGPTHPRLGRALGRYQVMEANIGPWSREALGREVTPDEFISNPEIQDAVFNHKFGGYVDKFGPEGAAQAWFAGPGGVGKTSRQDSLGTNVGQYSEKFRNALSGGQSGLLGAVSTQGSTREAPDMQQQKPQGLLGGFFQDQDKLDRVSMALMSLSGFPTPGMEQMMQGIQHRMADSRKDKKSKAQANKTAEWLRAQGMHQLADGVASGALSARDALAMAKGQGTQKPYTDMAKLNADLRSGLITEDQYKAAQAQMSQGDDSEKEERIARLMETGLDRNTAIGIADGRFAVSRDPVSKTVQIIDVATGNIIQKMDGGSQATSPQSAPQSSTNPELNFGPDIPDANFRGSFGAQGLGARALNNAADITGLPMPAPEINEAQTAIRNVGLQTVTLLQKAFPGRSSVDLMKRLEAVTATPGSLLEGRQGAVDTMTQTREMLAGLIEAESRKVSNPRGYTPKQVGEARQNRDQLESLLNQYDAILGQMSGGSSSEIDSIADKWAN